MDGEEVVVESGGCNIEELPNGERLLQATTSGKDSSQEERKNPPVDEGAVTGITSDETSAQVGSEGSVQQKECDRPPPQPNWDAGGNPTLGAVSSDAVSQQSDFLQKQPQEGQLLNQLQLSNEWSQERSVDINCGEGSRETEKGSEERDTPAQWGHQEESKDPQNFKSPSLNQTLGADDCLDPSAKGGSHSQQGLVPPDGNFQFNEKPAGGVPRTFPRHSHFTRGSSRIAGELIGNQSQVGGEVQYENNSREIKNADNSQRLQHGTLSSTIENKVNMLPMAPEASKARDSMSNIRMPGNQILNNDVFVPPSQRAFPIKMQHPSQISSHVETANTDSREGLSSSASHWMKHYRTIHSQGHSLTEHSHNHGNQMDTRMQPIFTDSSVQKEFSRNSSSVAPSAISSESSSDKRGFFSGSEMNHPKSLVPNYTESNLIAAGHNSSLKKVEFVDGRLLPNNVTQGSQNMKQPRNPVINFPQGELLSKTAGKHNMDSPNPANLAYKTKSGFLEQSSVLNKGYSSPIPSPWSPGGMRATPASTSVPFLHPNMSLSSPVPIVCSSLGEDSSSARGVVKSDTSSYPNDARSAPPLDTCSNQAQSMRPPSAPISSQSGLKTPFCCDECTASGGVSEKCCNKKSRPHFNMPPGNLDSSRSNVDQSSPRLFAGQPKPIQSAFTSAQKPLPNDHSLLHRALFSQNRSTPSPRASSPLISPPCNPLPSTIKHELSPSNPISTNVAKTHSGASSPCFPPQNTNFMHGNDSPYAHKIPPSYQATYFSNAPKTSSHNTLTYTNHTPSSYSNNSVTVNKLMPSFGMPINTKAGRTVSRTPLENLQRLQHQGHPAISTSSERKLTHICSTPNLVAPHYTSSIYTCSSNTSTYSSSIQSNQSQFNMDSANNGYPNLPAPPSYSDVIQQKNNSLKNHDLLASQHIGGCKKLLWQPFSDEKPMVHIKTEVITGAYPGEVQTPSQLPSSSSAPCGHMAFQERQMVTSEKDEILKQTLASSGHSLPQAQTINKYPMHSPDMCHQPMKKIKADIKPKLGENGTSIPPNYRQPKMLHRDMPMPHTPLSHSDNKQFKSWTPKIEVNPTDTKNEIKCTFKIKNSEFNETHFQNAFLNSCPKNTNIPLDKMNQISNALNETTKHIFNNKHPVGNESHHRPPPNGKPAPDKKPTVKTEPGFDPFPDASNGEKDSDFDEMVKRLKANRKTEIPECECLGPGYVASETNEGPYYTHLGSGSCLDEIRRMMEERTGLTGKAVRVEKIIYSGKEGKSTQGCPIAKWIVRRAGVEEKILCLVRQRRGHICPTACIVICIVAWEGVPKSVADDMYSYLVPTLTEFGLETDRRCGYNEQKTCACQGIDMKKRGASFSFGCSWSMYFNGCKFARSREAKRFRLKDAALDEVTETKFQNLATRLAPLYKSIAPESYQNQVFFEDKGYECRLGHRTENDEKPCRPFSGVTACVDFCAHAHKDLHNMNNGCTVVVTLTKHGPLERPDEEQLHVLPLYILDVDTETFKEKMKNGCIEILSNYPKVARIRATPVTPKKKKGKNSKKDSPSNKKENALASKLLNAKDSSYMQSQVAKNSTPVFSEKFPKATNISGLSNNIVNKANLFKSTGVKSTASSKGEVTTAISGNALANKSSDTQKQPPLPANANMYDEFWKYFYSYGTFPPANFLKDGNSADSMKFFASHLSDGKPVFATPDKSVGTLLQHPGSDLRKDMSGGVLTRPATACNIPLSNSNMKDIKCPYSVSSLTSDDFESPLHLLSEAVMIRSQTSVEKPRPAAPHQQAGANVSTPRKPAPNSELSSSMGVAGKGGMVLGAGGNLPPHLINQAFPNAKVPIELSKDQHSRFSSLNSNFDRKNIFDKDTLCQSSPLQTSKQSSLQVDPHTTESRPDCPDGCMRDSEPEVISAELEYNEQNFNDPDIGGVAIALTHGSVLFEVAKRELHATTALLNPNRYEPTRISLVFYQHKSMNLRYHGWYENERKLELQRQKRLQKMQEEAEKGQPIANSELKPGSRKKRKKDEPPVVNCVAEIKSMWRASIKHTFTQTTDSIITQWIDPQPTVTGPYQKWI